jgi:hypothetical protein
VLVQIGYPDCAALLCGARRSCLVGQLDGGLSRTSLRLSFFTAHSCTSQGKGGACHMSVTRLKVAFGSRHRYIRNSMSCRLAHNAAPCHASAGWHWARQLLSSSRLCAWCIAAEGSADSRIPLHVCLRFVLEVAHPRLFLQSSYAHNTMLAPVTPRHCPHGTSNAGRYTAILIVISTFCLLRPSTTHLPLMH